MLIETSTKFFKNGDFNLRITTFFKSSSNVSPEECYNRWLNKIRCFIKETILNSSSSYRLVLSRLDKDEKMITKPYDIKGKEIISCIKQSFPNVESIRIDIIDPKKPSLISDNPLSFIIIVPND